MFYPTFVKTQKTRSHSPFGCNRIFVTNSFKKKIFIVSKIKRRYGQRNRMPKRRMPDEKLKILLRNSKSRYRKPSHFWSQIHIPNNFFSAVVN